MIRMTLCLLAVAVVAAPLAASPAAAQSRDRDGVSVTIRKGPTYLNTRTIARPNTRASYDSSAVYQTGMPKQRINGFQRWPLPSTFDVPGY